MGFHTYDADRAAQLEDPTRYEYVSVDELLALFDPGPDDAVADLGSGTGFYTDDVAPYAKTVHAVDVQPEMHEFYREKGAPANVDFVTAETADLPLADGAIDAAFTTMTYHEFASHEALREIERVLGQGGRFAIADWTAEGTGERGPPLDERYDLAEVRSHLSAAGFEVAHADERRETLVVRAAC